MSVPAGAMMGGPPPGPPMGAPPMDPMAMGGMPPAPMGGGDPISQLSAAAAGLTDAGQSAMMILAQLMGQQASPEAMGAQTSPGPLAPQGPAPMGAPGF